MAEKVKVSRESALALFAWVGWKAADKWDNDRLATKMSSIEDVMTKEGEEDYVQPDEGVATTLIDVLAAIEGGLEFEVVDSEQEPAQKEEKEEKEEKPPRKEGKRARKREKAESEDRKEDAFDLKEVLESYASNEPKFECVDLKPQQAKELLRVNVRNRPYRATIAKRYAEDIIRKKWRLTLEPIVFDSSGCMASGQHRLEGLLIAEELRLERPDYYEEAYGWSGEITMPTALAFGADPEGNDLHDRGKTRSGGDVLFRRAEFDQDGRSDRDVSKMSNDLAVAARLCWLKTGKMKVSDAPHFPHSEMIDFIEEHPELKIMVEFVYEEEAKSEKRISKYLSRGYMAGLAYLFSASKTDPEEYQESGEINFGNLKVAQDFVSKFAAGIFEEDDDPIHQLREWFVRQMSKDSRPSRDLKVAIVVKSWLAYSGGEMLSAKDMRLGRKSIPKIGGLA